MFGVLNNELTPPCGTALINVHSISVDAYSPLQKSYAVNPIGSSILTKVKSWEL